MVPVWTQKMPLGKTAKIQDSHSFMFWGLWDNTGSSVLVESWMPEQCGNPFWIYMQVLVCDCSLSRCVTCHFNALTERVTNENYTTSRFAPPSLVLIWLDAQTVKGM